MKYSLLFFVLLFSLQAIGLEHFFENKKTSSFNSSISIFGLDQTDRLYFRLAGQSLSLRHPKRDSWRDSVEQGKLVEVAQEMMNEDSFTNIVTFNWANQYLAAEKGEAFNLNDALMTTIGVVKESIDARELLIGNFSVGPTTRLGYGAPSPSNNESYQAFEALMLSYMTSMRFFYPQWGEAPFTESAGILTSRWWAEKYYQGGTNRRAVVGLMNTFLCQPIEVWKTSNLSTSRIRQDIPRDPSNDPRIFQTECRTCHAPLDAMAGAFAHLDFVDSTIVSRTEVVPKYQHNNYTYSEGYITTDDSWKNFIGGRTDLGLGWPEKLQGRGVRELGQMVAEAEGFSKCLAKRTVSYFCGKDLSMVNSWVTELGNKFRNEDSYVIKKLFLRVVTSPNCDEEKLK